MLQFRGHKALSHFRFQKLSDLIKSIVPQISVIDAEYWYFCKIKRDLKQNELNILQKLLGIDPAQQPPVPEGEFVLVLPRPGTISPWSSKATDIVHHCGIEVVERIERGVAFYIQHEMAFSQENRRAIEAMIHDRMTEAVFHSLSEAVALFHHVEPLPLKEINILEEDRAALVKANQAMGLALSPHEIDYLLDYFLDVRRNPTDVELMMFAQANSEHCRHKIFNADWIIDGEQKHQSLFSMIRHTHQQHQQGTIVAYSDNAAIIEGATINRFCPGKNHAYGYTLEPTHLLMKVETHNHPTAISPFPGAATGVGGEIRDEGATGRGAKPKAGLTGFSVSNLRIPDFIQPWETWQGQNGYGKPVRIASALEIMLTGPIGGAAFNNEFGRPNLAGYFRTFEAQVAGEIRGYHKPIMLAGGIGQISERHTAKQDFSKDALLIQLGGPGMLIGLGGGAASSMDTGTNTEELDFDSVQRGNPEMQRRAQEVIDRCWQLERSGQPNPILSIHDVGAGGLSNALPELVHGAGCGGHFNLRAIPLEESGMSPMQIWCNEAQERYVLAIRRESLALFQAICERERCPYAVVGEAIIQQQLIVTDEKSSTLPINMPLSILLGKPPKMTRVVSHISSVLPPFDLAGIDLQEAAYRVLRLPAVADKTFLITIGDRSVGGMTARDQMVGPWQIPVADVAVTTMGYQTYLGEAFALGERAPLALIDPAASARMAVAEAITNMAAAAINDLSEIKLSANWMAAAGHAGEDAALYDAVHAVAMELCPQLGISIPVGKDSMSMKTAWQESNGNKEENTGSKQKEVIAPLSLIISAFARVRDVRKTLTPQLRTDCGETELILIDLGSRRNRLGGSALAQVYGQLGHVVPDISTTAEIEKLKRLFSIIQELNCADQILAYHDRSDGGLFVTLCEMAFAGHVGMTISLDQLYSDSLAKDTSDEIKPKMPHGRLLERAMTALFNEELGAVIQIKKQHVETVLQMLSEAGLRDESVVLGNPNEQDEIRFLLNNKIIFQEKRVNLQRAWSETTYQMQKLRDNPVCAQQEFDRILDTSDPGLSAELTFDIKEDIAAPFIRAGIRPKMAILREQGVNGHVEMAAVFDRAGFEAVDVHMSDIITRRVSLSDYKGFVACGGFSYGDVLGAGEGWAKSILFNARVRNEFESFFERSDTFALGVCNGCQMMSNLHEIIPSTDHWPHFERNLSEQFEARFVMVEIPKNPSLFFDGMVGSRLPIQVAHGEGYAAFSNNQQLESASSYISLRFIDHYGSATERYPFNPNGSPQGIAGMTSTDGRFTILMPHPERVFRTVQHSWHVDTWPEDSPWMKMFRNARKWVG